VSRYKSAGMTNFCQVLAVLVLLLVSPAAWAAEPVGQWRIASPDARVAAEVRRAPSGGLAYRVTLKPGRGAERLVVDWSALGIATSRPAYPTAATPDLLASAAFAGVERGSVHERYRMVSGKRRDNDARANSLTLNFDQSDGIRVSIDFRAYDDGVAFRYRLAGPKQMTGLYRRLEREATEFDLSGAERMFGQTYDLPAAYRPAYSMLAAAGGHAVGAAPPTAEATGWGFPALFRLPGAWALIHESGLDGQSYGSHLQVVPGTRRYRVAGPDAGEVYGVGSAEARHPLPWTLPWRVIVVGETAGAIAESNLLFHLASPNAIGDDAWVKPGLASWSWWSDRSSPRDPEKMKPFIDFAGDMAWPYSLVDANWTDFGYDRLQQLIDYAAGRSVRLLLWYNSGGDNNHVTEQPRNLMADTHTRRAEFARISMMGIAGVKIDFFHTDKQFMIQRYLEILRDAADYKLLVVYHGSTTPRGWQRTFPNLMSMEGVRGAEVYTLNDPGYTAGAPGQNSLLPFTRNVGGSMDFTPVVFSQARTPRLTTPAHEAATGILFESGVQHLPDSVEAYRALPSALLNYLKHLPAAWDETRFLPSEPGRYAVVARRSGERWYVAGLNGENREIKLKLNLGFIPHGATLLTDGKLGSPLSSSSYTPAKRPFQITLKPYGGFVLAPMSR